MAANFFSNLGRSSNSCFDLGLSQSGWEKGCNKKDAKLRGHCGQQRNLGIAQKDRRQPQTNAPLGIFGHSDVLLAKQQSVNKCRGETSPNTREARAV